ncbi:PTPRM phosphatase, partial [Nothoprocta ornata]|nr:PTPRM phosphatase [Nothoprocta ornata]
TCQKPRWGQKVLLEPDRSVYRKNEEVSLSCLRGLLPEFSLVKCSETDPAMGYIRSVKDVWLGRNTTGHWIQIQKSVKCVNLLRVVPGTLEVSATSIKLNWTCRFPHACERMQAMCRLAWPPLPPCEAEEITREEMLWGEKGTFTCPLLQPFTFYNVTISLPPSTVLFTRLVSTEEAVPDKPQNVSLDASTGLLSWSALPPCKGEILAYQLSITARDARESGFLEIERLRLEGSVTEYALPQHRPGRTYVVTVQGVTAAGAGPVSRREFRGSGKGYPSAAPNGSSSGAHGISPSQGTAVLPLRPIAQPHAAQSEHQLVVAQGHEPSALAGVCSAELQPFNASRQPRAYVAAVLNLTAPTAFVLGDGSRRHGYYNAPLQPDGNYTVLLRLVRRGQQ